MNDKILCVDDDPNLLAAFQRVLRNRFHVDTATDGQKGFVSIAMNGPYSVIISDMRMPAMDGLQFLIKVRDIAPDSVRMMLTGNNDQKTAMDAVNEGAIFRFLAKPCSPETLIKVIDAGIQQYRLITAEKQILEETLKGSLKVLTDILVLVNPTAFGRTAGVRHLISRFAAELMIGEKWKMEVAAMLSQLGCVALPEEILSKVYQGVPLSTEEELVLRDHPKVGSELIRTIPRLESIAETIFYQDKHFDGSGYPEENRRGEDIPLGARILKLLLDYDTLILAGRNSAQALAEMRYRKGWYDPALLEDLAGILATQPENEIRFVRVKELAPMMILDQDVRTMTGLLIIHRGQEVTPSLCERLKSFERMDKKIQEPIKVLIPNPSKLKNGDPERESLSRN